MGKTRTVEIDVQDYHALHDTADRLAAIERQVREFIEGREAAAIVNQEDADSSFIDGPERCRLEGMASARKVDVRLLRAIIKAFDADKGEG